jgi:chromosome segregation protein
VMQLQQRIADLDAERHHREKAILQLDLHAARAADDLERLTRRQEQNTTERGRYEDERRALDQRAAEAQDARTRLADERSNLEERLASAQQQLTSARAAAADAGRRVSEANAAWAALVERTAAAANDVRRLEDAARDLDARIAGRRDDCARMEQRRAELVQGVEESRTQLDRDLAGFSALRDEVAACDERAAALEARFQGMERTVRASRASLDTVRAEAGQHEVAFATAESDLSHLAQACADALQMTLEEVAAEVARAASEGGSTPPPPIDDGDVDETADTGEPPDAAETPVAAVASAPVPVTPEAAIARLKARIDRLGPVNMMAIEQFDELETRYGFLTGQRSDLLASIEQTGQAIKRIEKTTRERFHEAFGTINRYFGETFSTLFGGGKAGLVMLDDQDELESGIDIIAQPPGKRLQNVQLLSGGEKALTAMALMFALFRYRPSPFCLLDEIDAPLDDANVARFIEMLRSMQDQTQFILITHHRKTMEIADRLYGVTMEEPGVSKLISLQLH